MITGLDYSTSTKTLLDKSKQLSVHQLVAYHSVCQVYRTHNSKLPAYHYKRLFKLDQTGNVNTRTRGDEKSRHVLHGDSPNVSIQICHFQKSSHLLSFQQSICFWQETNLRCKEIDKTRKRGWDVNNKS